MQFVGGPTQWHMVSTRDLHRLRHAEAKSEQNTNRTSKEWLKKLYWHDNLRNTQLDRCQTEM